MKTMIYAMMFAAVFSMAVKGQSTPPAERYRDAIQLYKQADFRGAVDLFQQLAAEGFVSFDLFYNLGNSAYKNGDLGTSVLYFERALTLDPGNASVTHNLNVVRARLRDRVESIPLLFFVRWWNDLRGAHLPSVFFTWSVVFFWLLAAAAFVFFGYRDVLFRRIALFAGLLFFTAFTASLVLSLQRSAELNGHRSAVVMATEVTVRSTPDESGVESFIIHEGLKVDITESKNSLYRIRLEDGKTGWVEKSVLTRI